MKDLFGGLDIHTEKLYGTVLDERGDTVVRGSLPYTKKAIQSFFAGMPSSKLRIAIEACGIWRGAYKLLTELGYEVVLASPLKTHQIACKKKTDKVDSRVLADLLRTGYLPEVYIPSEDVLKLRDIARHRARLVRVRSMLQCKVKAYLLRDGIKFKRGWSRESLEYLKNFDSKIANFVSIIEATNEEIKQVTREINSIAGNMYLTNLLQTSPGIGKFSSLMILGEIGDIKRFSNPKSLVSYAGLCPGIYQSGSKSYDVRSRACNKWLKWIITECSGRAVMLDNRYMKHYYRVKKRKGFKVARRSVARKMLTDVWHMLTKEEPFRAS
jgi:transposase